MKKIVHDWQCDALWVNDELVKERCTKECNARRVKAMREARKKAEGGS